MTHGNKLVDYCDISCETGGLAEEKDQASNRLFRAPRFRDSPKTHIKAENRQIADAQFNNSRYSSEVSGFSPATEWVRAKTTMKL